MKTPKPCPEYPDTNLCHRRNVHGCGRCPLRLHVTTDGRISMVVDSITAGEARDLAARLLEAAAALEAPCES